LNINEVEIKKNTSKFNYIVNYILEEIQNGKIGIGASLPSLNELSQQFGVSRITAIGAYRQLKAMGLIRSNQRKGFYVVSTKNTSRHHIFLFLDELSGFKNVLYKSIKEGVGRKGTVDVFFHHFNASVFETIIRENIGNYTSYIIMPIPQKNCGPALQTIPESKLYILDVGLHPYGKKYPCVCQNFEKDIIVTLTSGLDLLGKYNKLILVYPDVIPYEKAIVKGFNHFCRENSFESEKIRSAENCKPVKGECYIIIYDDELVSLVNSIREANLELGKDIGILSYNETPLKSIVANGITTISTDFRFMGLTMAEMVLNRKKDHIENPCYLTRRRSL
jgi:DNA-binding transcriptional regulator YhcF (GntR family)